MAIHVDPIATHDDTDNGNSTIPPGITGLDWCHCISDTSLDELTAFVTDNQGTIGADPANIRTPQDASPSVCTYIGLTLDQRVAAIAAGAIPGNMKHVRAIDFDGGDGSTSLYEPLD